LLPNFAGPNLAPYCSSYLHCLYSDWPAGKKVDVRWSHISADPNLRLPRNPRQLIKKKEKKRQKDVNVISVKMWWSFNIWLVIFTCFINFEHECPPIFQNPTRFPLKAGDRVLLFICYVYGFTQCTKTTSPSGFVIFIFCAFLYVQDCWIYFTLTDKFWALVWHTEL
jgi:hypothetical protein